MAQTQGTGSQGAGTHGAGKGGGSSADGFVGRVLGRLGRWGGLVFLLAGLATSGWGGYEGAYTVGWAGTHGTLTVKQCVDDSSLNSSRNSRKKRLTVRCDGRFASADGSSTDANATVRVRSEYASGTELSVQQVDAPSSATAADGDYVRTDKPRAWRFFAAFFGGWVLTGLGVFCLATGYAPFGRSRVSYDEAWEASGRGATRPVLIGMLGVGLLGAGVSYLVSYFV
ncbi:hypothetical protein ACQEWB_35900 [Streptomyces sp. CA-249302]|uniref:hypothetical protein n=1 Tax=Streptomyces sp. CA-249302 TaxID=3240058 RepID=UPI003D8E7188